MDQKYYESGITRKSIKIDMQNWLQIPNRDKVEIYNEIAVQTGMTAYAVEKDWWVTQTIGLIFQTGLAPHLVFKGGTSLRKAWNLIERFS